MPNYIYTIFGMSRARDYGANAAPTRGRAVPPSVEGNRRAALTHAEDQGVCRRVRLTVRLGLDPSHFTVDEGWDSCEERGDERP